MLSCLSHFPLFVTLWTVAHQVPLSMGFSKQEYWSGLPFPPPGDLPNPGTEPTSLTSHELAGRFFTTGATWEALFFPLLLCMGTSRHSAENEGETGPGVYAFLSVFLRVLRSWAKPPVGQFNPKYGAFGKPHWDLFQGIHEGKALRDNGGDGQLETSETYICL